MGENGRQGAQEHAMFRPGLSMKVAKLARPWSSWGLELGEVQLTVRDTVPSQATQKSPEMFPHRCLSVLPTEKKPSSSDT